ncbi:MAG: DUF3987 domain-containing protein [Bacteroides sp.]|nr:DUF3987 domain-containing protein [Bacteroides sp.]
MKKIHLMETLFSEFSNVRSKASRTVTGREVVERLSGSAYREAVERHRRLRAQEGCEAQAQAVKNNMPCVVPAGVCLGGHAVRNLVNPAPVVCIDLDDCGGQMAVLKERARELPWVWLAFVSISGEGLKLWVRIDPADAERDYALLYATVGRAVSSHLGHPYDEKCKIRTQPCYYSWDPELYCNPSPTVFTPDGEADMTEEAPLPPPPTEMLATKSAPATHSSPAAPSLPGFLLGFLDDFEKRHPFRRGERNDTALQLGRMAAIRHFSSEEAQKVLDIYTKRYAGSDFNAADIRQRFMAGYQYVASSPREKESTARGQNRGHFSFDPSPTGEEGLTEEEILDENNLQRGNAPYLPDEVFHRLPDFLKRCVRHAANNRERDLMLLGSLNSCSALFPGVRFFYKNVLYSPHFYLATVAPAGSGKSVIGFTSALMDPTQEHYENENIRRRKEYEQEMLAWEQEVARARQEKRLPDASKRPEEPRPCRLKLSANTSKSRLIESLAAAGELGCYAATTEINTIISANGQDYGRFDDVLCKAAHHEEVSLSYKNSGDPIVVPHPRLALNMAGTQEQFQGFFRSLEVGLYSRFAIYTREAGVKWEVCEPGANELDLPLHFRRLGNELFAMHRQLLSSPTLVTFSHEQWMRHSNTFEQLLSHILVEGKEAAGGILFRHGLLVMRLASVLTVFRKWEGFRDAKEYRCTDEDFDCALQLTTTLLSHSLLMSSTLPATSRRPVLIRKFDRMDLILSQLSPSFTYTEFTEVALGNGLSESTAKRLLRKAIEHKVVVKQKDKYRQKSTARQNEGPKEK